MKIVGIGSSLFGLAAAAVLLSACQPATSSSGATPSVTLPQEDRQVENHNERRPCCRRAAGGTNR